jgi:iron complex outermembrane receptor protein
MIFFLLVLSTGSFAQSEVQTGSIKGTITNNDNTPAAAATVRLKGNKKAVFTNNEGIFTIIPSSYQVLAICHWKKR